MESITDLIELLVALVGAICWPLLVVFLVLYFGEPVKVLIKNLREGTLKVGPSGFEFTAKIQKLAEHLPYVDSDTKASPQVQLPQTNEERIKQRHEKEKETKEIYLVHVIKPSERPGQTFDVFIYLKEHWKKGRELGLADVSYAEFFLGRYWSNKIFKVENILTKDL